MIKQENLNDKSKLALEEYKVSRDRLIHLNQEMMKEAVLKSELAWKVVKEQFNINHGDIIRMKDAYGKEYDAEVYGLDSDILPFSSDNIYFSVKVNLIKKDGTVGKTTRNIYLERDLIKVYGDYNTYKKEIGKND